LKTSFAIETRNLRKVYGTGVLRPKPFVAVDDLNLRVERGMAFGFLGPNGAGKTTTINMLLGSVYATSGAASLLDMPAGNRRVRARVGFLPEKFQFHDYLTAEEFLDLHGRLYGMERKHRRAQAHEALDMVGLLDRRKSRIGEFSKGMQQRIGLAQAIFNNPELVILDEPTSALDPIGRRSVRDLIRRLKEKNTTVFLNSHLLSEIEMTCDEVAIIKSGRIVRQGKLDDLLAAKATVDVRVDNYSPAIADAIARASIRFQETEGAIQASVADPKDLPDLAAAIVGAGGRLREFTPRRESLEELFIRVVDEE